MAGTAWRAPFSRWRPQEVTRVYQDRLPMVTGARSPHAARGTGTGTGPPRGVIVPIRALVQGWASLCGGQAPACGHTGLPGGGTAPASWGESPCVDPGSFPRNNQPQQQPEPLAGSAGREASPSMRNGTLVLRPRSWPTAPAEVFIPVFSWLSGKVWKVLRTTADRARLSPPQGRPVGGRSALALRPAARCPVAPPLPDRAAPGLCLQSKVQRGVWPGGPQLPS